VDDGKGRLFVNNETTAELIEIDAQKLTVKNRWPMKGCEEPTGLAMDVKHERLFAVCSNKVMAVVDAKSGAEVATVPIGTGVDGVVFDPSTQLAISSNGEGNLTVVHEDSPTKFSVVQTVTTQRGARTVELDPATHRIFTVTSEFGPPPAATADNPHPRPAPVAGSFVLLVVEQR